MNNLIQESLDKLKAQNIQYPELDLRILLNHCSFDNEEIFLSNFNAKKININNFKKLLLKRLNKEPISKIIKNKYFWKHNFYVNNNVLDPRPETEIIIEETIQNITKEKKINILDIGTGSGCLAISLAKEFKNSKILAIDISDDALKIANKNIKKYNCQKQIKVKNTTFEKINDKFDLIISNPPYLSLDEYERLSFEVKNFDPKIALLGGNDGLDFYRNFSLNIEKLMKNSSLFICEIGYKQYEPCKKIFNKSNLILKKVTKDLQKIERTLTFLKI